MTLAIAPLMLTLLVVAFVVISVGLIFIVLLQRPSGGGLSGAFGAGSGSGQTAFGTKTGDVLTGATIALFALWLLFAVGLNFAARPEGAAQPAAMGGAGEDEQIGEEVPPRPLPGGSEPEGPDAPGDELPPEESPIEDPADEELPERVAGPDDIEDEG